MSSDTNKMEPKMNSMDSSMSSMDDSMVARSTGSKMSPTSTMNDRSADEHMANIATGPLNIVEIYQSHGCSSCPPTNRQALNLINSQDPNTLVLDFHVTYWDYLGWPDSYARREHDARQWEYARPLGRTNVYTPQVVVNGVAEGVGNTSPSFNGIIAKGRREGPPPVNLEVVEGNTLLVSNPEDRLGRVVEIVYDPRPDTVQIQRGENRGLTETSRNVVKEIRVLDNLAGDTRIVKMGPRPEQGWQRVVLVQEAASQVVIAATRV